MREKRPCTKHFHALMHENIAPVVSVSLVDNRLHTTVNHIFSPSPGSSPPLAVLLKPDIFRRMFERKKVEKESSDVVGTVAQLFTIIHKTCYSQCVGF